MTNHTSARVTRVRIAPRFADLKVEPVDKGVRLIIGTTHFQLTAKHAHQLADALVDAVEQETP